MKRYLLIKPNDPEVEFGYFDFHKYNESQYRIKFITGKFKSNTIDEDIEIILDDKLNAEQEFLKFKNKLYFLKFNDISKHTVNHWDKIEFIKNNDIGLIISQDDNTYDTF